MRAMMILCLMLAAVTTGCGAAEHHENLAGAKDGIGELRVLRHADEERKSKSLAQIALEQRELRKEIADAKRITALQLAEMTMEGDR